MKTRRLRLTSNEKVLFVTSLMLLFTSVDTVFFGTNSIVSFTYIPRIIAAFSILVFALFGSKKTGACPFIVFAIQITIVIFSSFINNSEAGSVISRLLFISAALFVVAFYDRKLFFLAFDTFMFIVCLFTLVLELFAYAFPGVLRFLPTITNTSGSTYYFALFASINKAFVGSRAIRCSGVFWEPGAFSFYLIIAMIVQTFILNKFNPFKFVLYFICLILTFSTTGVFSLLALLIAILFRKDSKEVGIALKRIRPLILLSVVLMLLFLILGKDTFLYQLLFDKIISNNSSFKTRWASMILPFYIAKDYPFFGVGPNNVGIFMQNYAYYSSLEFQSSKMLTNTSTYQFAAYGILFGIIFILGLFLFVRKFTHKRIVSTICLFLTILLCFSGENFYSFFPYLIVFYGFDIKAKKVAILTVPHSKYRFETISRKN